MSRLAVAVGVVLASRGYPASSEPGVEIRGIDAASAVPGVTVFHAGTTLDNGKLVTAGGRVLTVVDGQLEQVDAFEPDRSFTKEAPPAVRAPEEHRRCLLQLNALAAVT